MPAWTNEIDEILQEIHNADQASAIMTIRKPYSDAFRRNRAEIEMAVQNQPDADAELLQLYMVRFYNKEYEEKTLDELQEIGKTINMSISEANVELIEKSTRKQSQSKQWYRLRAGRVTASVFFNVCRTSLKKPSASLIERICWPEKFIFSLKPTNYGKKYEPLARSDYITSMKDLHTNFKVTECGLFVSVDYPYFGASPDGIID